MCELEPSEECKWLPGLPKQFLHVRFGGTVLKGWSIGSQESSHLGLAIGKRDHSDHKPHVNFVDILVPANTQQCCQENALDGVNSAEDLPERVAKAMEYYSLTARGCGLCALPPPLLASSLQPNLPLVPEVFWASVPFH